MRALYGKREAWNGGKQENRKNIAFSYMWNIGFGQFFESHISRPSGLLFSCFPVFLFSCSPVSLFGVIRYIRRLCIWFVFLSFLLFAGGGVPGQMFEHNHLSLGEFAEFSAFEVFLG